MAAGTFIRRLSRALGAVVVAAGVTTANGGAALALPPGPPTRAASTQVSLADTISDNVAGENIDLVGALHLVTQRSGSEADGWAVDWRVNAHHVKGTGQSSGRDYVLNGAAWGSLPPGPPVRTAVLEGTFSLFPPGPPVHPPSPIRFLIAVSFGEGGHITHIDAHVTESPPPTVD